MRAALVLLVGALALVVSCGPGGDQASVGDVDGSASGAPTEAPLTTDPVVTTIASAPATTSAPPSSVASTVPEPLASTLDLVEVARIGGPISPKSIVHSGEGLFFAQNMMYRHTVTVYDRDHQLVATIDDAVDLAAHDRNGEFQGSPVEAAFTSDGSSAYVSNYQMYGPGFSRPGDDDCNKGDWDGSFVYRIDTETLGIVETIPVGAVPKFLAVTPDDRYLLVSNWCSFDVSVIDLESGAEVGRPEVGRHPRGIAVSPDSLTAYVAVMGSRDLVTVSLPELDLGRIPSVGANPRHLVMAPDGRSLYVSLNGESRVAKVDLATNAVTASVATGSAPRTMAISGDGSALYVVNYESDTLSKVDTAELTLIDEVGVPHHPIGVTYDEDTRKVWVSSYSGLITVFEERTGQGG